MAQIHHPFDKLFKVAFTDIKCIKALITTYFDAVITEALLLDTLKIVPNEHLNADFVKKCPDILCYCHLQRKGQLYDCYIILEHKSYNSRKLLEQMDEYERVVKTVHCKRAAAFGVNSIDQQHHPLVLKVLFHHGNAPLRMSLHSSEMSQDPEFDRFIQATSLILIDLHKQSLSHLITHTDTLGSTECVLKILSEKELIRNMFQDTSFLHPYTLHLSTDFKELLQFIIFDVIRKNEPMAQVSTEQIIDRLALILQLQSEHMITIADSLRAEGRRTGEKIGIEKGRAEGVHIGMEKGMEKGMKRGMEKGRKAGILEAAKNMFRQNFDINIIGQVTGLPRAQLLRLAI